MRRPRRRSSWRRVGDLQQRFTAAGAHVEHPFRASRGLRYQFGVAPRQRSTDRGPVTKPAEVPPFEGPRERLFDTSLEAHVRPIRGVRCRYVEVRHHTAGLAFWLPRHARDSRRGSGRVTRRQCLDHSARVVVAASPWTPRGRSCSQIDPICAHRGLRSWPCLPGLVYGPGKPPGWLCAGQLTAERLNTRMDAAVTSTAQPARTSRLREASALVLLMPQMSCRPAPPWPSTP